jgi:hypothetical protein
VLSYLKIGYKELEFEIVKSLGSDTQIRSMALLQICSFRVPKRLRYHLPGSG